MDKRPLETASGYYERTIAVAESCTGGRLGDRITNKSGSSAYFLGGIVSYDNRIKEELLGVTRKTLEAHGAVSAETACEMASGVRERFGAETGLAVTGVAGPGGGTDEKPVGTVFIALSTPEGTVADGYLFSGERDEIKEQTVIEALRTLAPYLPGYKKNI